MRIKSLCNFFENAAKIEKKKNRKNILFNNKKKKHQNQIATENKNTIETQHNTPSLWAVVMRLLTSNSSTVSSSMYFLNNALPNLEMHTHHTHDINDDSCVLHDHAAHLDVATLPATAFFLRNQKPTHQNRNRPINNKYIW